MAAVGPPSTVGPRLSGYLWKNGDSGLRWMRRFFVLTSDAQLVYYDHVDAAEPRHPPVSLQGSSIHHPGRLWRKQEHTFRLELPGKIDYTLAAETSDAYERWIEALASCGVSRSALSALSLGNVVAAGGSVATQTLMGTVGTVVTATATATATAAAAVTHAGEESVRVHQVDLYIDSLPGSDVLRGPAGRANSGFTGKFASACVGHDGWVYAIPEDASCVIRFDPLSLPPGGAQPATPAGERPRVNAELVHSFDGANGPQTQKFGSTAVLAADGCLYCPPSRLAKVLRVDTRRDCVGPRGRFIGESFGLTDSCKWLGACLGSDGCVYCVPFDHERVLRIDPEAQTTTLIGPNLKGSGKWEGAANGPDGAIWAVCHAAKRLLRITPATQAVELVGAEIAKARLSADFVGAELGPDGHLCAARSLQGPPEALH